MNSELEKTLMRVAENTFASMAFVLPADDEERPDNDDEPRASAFITFSGPFDGGIFLSVPKRILPILAANMLGVENLDTISPEEQQDALTELLNVICGNLLPVITSPKEIFHLCQPYSVAGNEADETSNNEMIEAKVRLQLDCGRADLSLCLNRPSGAIAV
jgi:CheY-specific phosphatase CheX